MNTVLMRSIAFAGKCSAYAGFEQSETHKVVFLVHQRTFFTALAPWALMVHYCTYRFYLILRESPTTKFALKIMPSIDMSLDISKLQWTVERFLEAADRLLCLNEVDMRRLDGPAVGCIIDRSRYPFLKHVRAYQVDDDTYRQMLKDGRPSIRMSALLCEDMKPQHLLPDFRELMLGIDHRVPHEEATSLAHGVLTNLMRCGPGFRHNDVQSDMMADCIRLALIIGVGIDDLYACVELIIQASSKRQSSHLRDCFDELNNTIEKDTCLMRSDPRTNAELVMRHLTTTYRYILVSGVVKSGLRTLLKLCVRHLLRTRRLRCLEISKDTYGFALQSLVYCIEDDDDNTYETIRTDVLEYVKIQALRPVDAHSFMYDLSNVRDRPARIIEIIQTSAEAGIIANPIIVSMGLAANLAIIEHDAIVNGHTRRMVVIPIVSRLERVEKNRVILSALQKNSENFLRTA